MKKWLLIFVIGGLLFWTWVALRLTNTLTYYSAASASNLPTFHPGDIFFASKLKKPDYNRFICFKLPNEKSPWIFRCIGKGGDQIELKDTKVYRNDTLLAEPFTSNEYYITQNKLDRIKGYVERNKNDLTSVNDTLYRLSLSDKELKDYHLNLPQVISKKGVVNNDLFVDFKKLGYNEDNFGPVKIPENCYFLLGDNRHNAFDSRYIGFIKKNEIVSTVLGH